MFTHASPVSGVANVGVASQSRPGPDPSSRRHIRRRSPHAGRARRPAGGHTPPRRAPAAWATRTRRPGPLALRAVVAFLSCVDPQSEGVGESIYSGFTHYPHHLIFDSVCKPGSPAYGGGWCTWQGRMGWWKGVPCSRADSGVPVSIVHALPPLAAVTSRRLRQKSSASAPGRSLVSLR